MNQINKNVKKNMKNFIYEITIQIQNVINYIINMMKIITKDTTHHILKIQNIKIMNQYVMIQLQKIFFMYIQI